VTDDNRDRHHAVTSTLREAGHCVFAVRSGWSALELLAVLPNINLLITNTCIGDRGGGIQAVKDGLRKGLHELSGLLTRAGPHRP
jgi:hypothetical protein